MEVAGNHALTLGQVFDVIGTKTAKLSRSLFGGSTSATSEMLADDVKRIVDLYRRNGYRDARVRVTASTDAAALDSAALTAALVSANRGEGLYVRFTIDEGQPTLITQVDVDLGDNDDVTPANKQLCEQILADLAVLYKHPRLATPVGTRCIGVAQDLAFREDEAADTDEKLKNELFSRGRPRAEVVYEPVVLGPRRIVAKYKVTNVQQLKIGKVVIRGNFKTRDSIIKGELGLKEGTMLTSDKLAEGARRLRNTALFDSVAITMPDLDNTGAGAVNAVVEVTERYDYLTVVALEAGYSSFNGAFSKVSPSLQNLFGVGVSLDLSGTIGFEVQPATEGQLDLRQLAAEANLRFPKFIPRQLGSPIEFQTDLAAFHRRQETERFGLLRTTGATISLSRTWDYPRREHRQAKAITLGLHYDYRSRERNVDALRPIGADMTSRRSRSPRSPVRQAYRSSGSSASIAAARSRRSCPRTASASRRSSRTRTRTCFAGHVPEAADGGDALLPDRQQPRVARGPPLRPGLPGFPFGRRGPAPRGRAVLRRRRQHRARLRRRPARDRDHPGRPAADRQRVADPRHPGRRQHPDARQRRCPGPRLVDPRDRPVRRRGPHHEPVVVRDHRRHPPGRRHGPVRLMTPFGSVALEYAVPLRPQLGDDPRGRIHFYFAARAQF